MQMQERNKLWFGLLYKVLLTVKVNIYICKIIDMLSDSQFQVA